MYVIAFGNKGRDGFGGRVRYQSCIFEVMHVTMKVSNSGIEVTSNDNVACKLMLQTGSCLENLIEKVSFTLSQHFRVVSLSIVFDGIILR